MFCNTQHDKRSDQSFSQFGSAANAIGSVTNRGNFPSAFPALPANFARLTESSSKCLKEASAALPQIAAAEQKKPGATFTAALWLCHVV